MKIPDLPLGSKHFGFFSVGQSHGGFDVHLPLHTVKGHVEGPTLLVQAGLSGLEIEPAMILPQLVEALDPQALRGTLLLVPLLNTSGFEFEQVEAAWDGKDLHSLGRGDAQGSVSERLLHAYYHEVVMRADAVLELRTGAQWSYGHYLSTYEDAPPQAVTFAQRLGLAQMLTAVPHDRSLLSEATREGKVAITAFIGGGPGLRDYREDDLAHVRRTVENSLRFLGMIDGALELPPAAQVYRHLVTLRPGATRGLVFMRHELRGQRVEPGEVLGIVRHPFTGETQETIYAPVAGVLIDAGAAWPMLPENTPLAILAEPLTTP